MGLFCFNKIFITKNYSYKALDNTTLSTYISMKFYRWEGIKI